MKSTITSPSISPSRLEVFIPFDDYLLNPNQYTLCTTIQYKFKFGTTAGNWKVVVKDCQGNNIKCQQDLVSRMGKNYLILNRLSGIRGYHWLEFVHNGRVVYKTIRPVKLLSRNNDGVTPDAWMIKKPSKIFQTNVERYKTIDIEQQTKGLEYGLSQMSIRDKKIKNDSDIISASVEEFIECINPFLLMQHPTILKCKELANNNGQNGLDVTETFAHLSL
jgi:hypothetical protein